MFVHGKLADAFELLNQADQHVALAKSGVRPVTNFYAALVLAEQAHQLEKI